MNFAKYRVQLSTEKKYSSKYSSKYEYEYSIPDNIMIIKYLFAYWVIFHAFCRLLIILKSTFWKNSFRNAIKVSNSLDPDQAWHFVGSDLGPNCLQRLSAEDIGRQKEVWHHEG